MEERTLDDRGEGRIDRLHDGERLGWEKLGFWWFCWVQRQLWFGLRCYSWDISEFSTKTLHVWFQTVVTAYQVTIPLMSAAVIRNLKLKAKVLVCREEHLIKTNVLTAGGEKNALCFTSKKRVTTEFTLFYLTFIFFWLNAAISVLIWPLSVHYLIVSATLKAFSDWFLSFDVL